MSSPRDVVDRVGGRFPLPDDPFDRLARRRDRKRRNQRIGAGALGLLIVLVAAGAFARAIMVNGVPADAPVPTATETPPDEFRRPYVKGVYDVTIDDGGCTLEGRDRPVVTEKLVFNFTNSTGQLPITFEVGMISPGATYRDLVAFVDDQRAAGAVGIHRPSFFKAPLRGYTLQGFTGHFFGKSLLTLTSTHSNAMWYRAREPGAHRVVPGVYAVACYRGPVGAAEPVGVVGPVVVR